MHYRNIIFVEAPLGDISEAKIEKLVAEEMDKFQNDHWDFYAIGGRWDKTLNGRNIIPIEEIRQKHLDDCHSMILGGSWFAREIYRPWRPIGNGPGKMFERKPKTEMPCARWLRKEYKTQTGRYNYQFFAVAFDIHN